MPTSLFKALALPFRLLWQLIDGIRRVAANAILLLLVIAVLAAIFLRPTPDVPQGAALLVRPSGEIVEQTTIDTPLAMLTGKTRAAQTALADLLDAVRAAAKDKRIAMLILETDDIEAAGLARLDELRAAIAEFKATGKPVLARGEHFSQGHYYLASIADEVHIAPDGYALLSGFARYATYFRGALDTLGIKIHLFRVGEYKSFAEPFTRSTMSDEDRAATLSLLEGLWGHLRTRIAQARGLSPEQFNDYVLGYHDRLKATAGDAAQAARNAGLVDRLSTREDWRARLWEKRGEVLGNGAFPAKPARPGDGIPHIDVDDYLAAIHAERINRPAARIAVLVAQGTIVDGDQEPGNTGGDSFARLIREAREDDNIKAVVVRIDSPGGSAWASEVIRHELELTRRAGKPVIASMSAVAASGGYWIAVGADEIFAQATTITGSIGVFGLFPEIAEPMNRLGLTVDGVATAPLAAALDPRLPLSPEAADTLQLSVEYTYRRFINLVAQARKMKPEEVDRVARGRVWTGDEALAHGLIDKLGGLDTALAAAATRANLTDYTVVWPAPRIHPMQQLLQQLLTGARTDTAATRRAPARQLMNQLTTGLDALARWNDPRHVYAHCLCATP
jgi:protease-4